jgi:hypothetical protein
MKNIILAALADRLSVWSQYTVRIPGHAASAQIVVLSIFMGGMARSAWFVSRCAPGWKKLVKGYALAGLAIDGAGLLFQSISQTYTSVSQEVVQPFIGNEALAHT